MDVARGVLVHRRATALLLAVVLSIAGVVAITLTSAPAYALPAGFQDQTVWGGFTHPTAVAFANNGAVFVAEKQGTITRFDSPTDTTGDLIADLRAEVHNRQDRGLVGLQVDPDFGPSRPYIYVQYTYDHILGDASPAPRWGTLTSSYDDCPTPLPGDTTDGCVASGRVSKLVLSSVTGTVQSEQVLVEDWCQQFSAHSVGTIIFGADGNLYAGGGDGANYNFVDYGQAGGSAGSPTPVNPCGDPPAPIGTAPSPSTATGGALRSQSSGITARESATGKISLSGSIIRIDPDTGLGVPGNPWFSKPGADANEQRVIAYGLRNPFRFSARGGTNEIWVGDVGWNDWEEIDVVPDATTMTAPLNYGWPCYEGNDRQPGYEGTNLGVCTDLYNAGASAVESPLYTYNRNEHPVASDGCPIDQGSALAGVAYYNQPTGPGVTPYPTKYDGALFFTDYNRKCIWVMLNGANGQPDPTKLEAFDTLAGGAVDLVLGPSGDLFYPNLIDGEIHRIRYFPTNTPPVPSFTATPKSGPAPLAVSFDASASSDPDGDTLTYEWDLDGNGAYDDATGVTANRTYATGAYTVGLKLTDSRGAYQTTSQVISSGNDFPTPSIAAPSVSLTWKVGDPISFSGSATDPEDGPLGAADLSWLVRLLTCDAGGNNCVTRSSHPFDGVAGGTLDAPDWAGEGNNLLEFALTATDSAGLEATETVRIVPKKVTLSFAGNPSDH
ncbi:MAG TPA: PQQ-dependent sugar dehydrogenase, partial [Acidimicrobiia bacterium]|nr:PQQ-dependent sugar dehydrogenase [Acidimicrobiia bacterium]